MNKSNFIKFNFPILVFLFLTIEGFVFANLIFASTPNSKSCELKLLEGEQHRKTLFTQTQSLLKGSHTNLHSHLEDGALNLIIGSKDRAVGVHGTSWQAVRNLLQIGRLTASNHSKRKGLYFFGINSHLPESLKREDEDFSPEELFKQVSAYSQTLSYRFRFLELLGLEINSKNLDFAFDYLEVYGFGFEDLSDSKGSVDRKLKQLKREKSLNKETVKSLSDQAEKSRGFIVYLNSRLLERYPVRSVFPDAGLFVETKEGICLEDIQSIEALGPVESQWLKGLIAK
jgi:hypothetical protein